MLGELNQGLAPALARAMAAAIPDSKLKIFAGPRHLAPIEGAQIVNEALGDFLAGLAQ